MKTERLTIHKIIRRLVSGWSCRKDWRLCILTGVVILLSKLLIAFFKPHSRGAAGSFLSWNFVKNGLLCNWCRFLVRCIDHLSLESTLMFWCGGSWDRALSFEVLFIELENSLSVYEQTNTALCVVEGFVSPQ